MTDLTIFDESVALVKKNAPQNGMPLLCWDLYSVFFRALNAAQRDLSLLNQLSKEILAGKIAPESVILLDSFDGQLVFRNQTEL